MINLKFGLWHSGCGLSYLRYLTFKTLRYFHPKAKIQLFVGTKFRTDNHDWGEEKQDFEDPSAIQKDYIPELSKLDVEVNYVDWFPQYTPNQASDLFKWWYIKSFGGFYLDTDQIILGNFETLPLDTDFIYSSYNVSSCGLYFPVGVLGASKESEIAGKVMEILPNVINPNDYNSSGPFGFRRIFESRMWKDKTFNAPSIYFYPIAESLDVNKIYNGSFKIPSQSYALHWFAGHPLSQAFNKKYDEDFAKTSNDTISCLIRDMKP